MEPERMATLLGWVMIVEAVIIIVSLIWGYVTHDRLADLNRRVSAEERYTAGVKVSLDAHIEESIEVKEDKLTPSDPAKMAAVRFTDRELETTLAALYLWDMNARENGGVVSGWEKRFKNLSPLTGREIDALCDRFRVALKVSPNSVAEKTVVKVAVSEQKAKDQGTVISTSPLFPNGERYALAPDGRCPAIQFNVLSEVYKDLATKRPVNHEVYTDYDTSDGACGRQSAALMKELIADANLGRLVRDKAAAAGFGDVDLAKVDINVTNGGPDADVKQVLEDVANGLTRYQVLNGIPTAGYPFDTQLDRVEAKINAIEAKLASVTEQDLAEMARLIQENKDLVFENGTQREVVECMRQEIKDLTLENDNYEADAKGLTEEVAKLKQHLADRIGENDIQYKITEELKRDLQRVSLEAEGYAATVKRIEGRVDDLLRVNEELTEQCYDWKEVRAAQVSEIAELKKTVGLYQAGSKASAEKLGDQERKVNDLKNELDNRKVTIESYRAAEVVMRDEIKNLKDREEKVKIRLSAIMREE